MKGWVSIALVLIVASATSTAQTQLPWYVISSGGNIGAVSGQRVLSGTFGQVVTGVSVLTTGSALSQGFWLPINTAVGVDDDQTPVFTGGSVSNYPNPFSTSTTIRLSMPVEGPVTLRVFDLVGNLVRSMTFDMSLTGAQEFQFDGLGDTGAPLGDGTYVYEVVGQGIDGNNIRTAQRMTILR